MAEKVENKTQLDHIAYSRNVVHSYSPGIQKLLDLCVDYIPYCKRAYQEGKDVIWFIGTGGVASSIIYSCGAIPAAVTEIGRLCSEKAVVVAEDFFQVPNETCAMVKSDLGEFYLQRGEISNRIFYSSKACEPYNIGLQLLADYGYDIHVMDIGFRPAGSKERMENMRKHYREELIKLVKWINGKEPDLDLIKKQMAFYNKVLRKIRTILNLRLKHPTYMGSLPTMLLLMGSGHYFGRPEEYDEMLDVIIEEMSALEENSYHDEVAHVCWSGSRGQEFNIFEAIDEAGGAVLYWNSPDNIVHTFELEGDPIDEMVRFAIGDFYSGTTAEVARVVLDNMKKYDVTGVIFYAYLGCSFATIDIELKRKYFQEQGIPGLSLIGSFDVGSVSGQVTTRVKAFIEMLAKKQRSKHANEI